MRPSEKTIQIWKEFIEWLRDQECQTIFDFQDFISFKYMISNDKTTIKAKEDEQIIIHKKIENHRKEFMYQQSNELSVNKEEYNNAIIEAKVSGYMIMHDIIFIHQ